MVSGKYWRWKIKWEVTLTNLVYSLLILKNIARFFYNYFCEISPLSTSTLYHLFDRVYFTQEPHYEYRVEYNFWRKNPRRDEKIPQRSYEAFPYDICDFNFGKFKKKRKNSSNIILHVWRLILVETRNCPFFCLHLFLCSFSGNAYTKRTTEATEWIFKRSRSTHACIIQGKAFPCLENFIPSSRLASSSFCISRARAPFCRAIDMALERVKSHFEKDGEKALFLALRVQNRQRLVIVRRYKILTLKKVENSWKFAGGSCVRGIFNAESKNREREREKT